MFVLWFTEVAFLVEFSVEGQSKWLVVTLLSRRRTQCSQCPCEIVELLTKNARSVTKVNRTRYKKLTLNFQKPEFEICWTLLQSVQLIGRMHFQSDGRFRRFFRRPCCISWCDVTIFKRQPPVRPYDLTFHAGMYENFLSVCDFLAA